MRVPTPLPNEQATSDDAPAALVVGNDDWSVNWTAHRLAAAGWRVRRCSDSVAAPFPCNALAGGGCPIDRGDVQVVVAVRSRPSEALEAGELGAICGLRAGIPLVVSGSHAPGGLEAFGRQVTADDVVATCERAIAEKEGCA